MQINAVGVTNRRVKYKARFITVTDPFGRTYAHFLAISDNLTVVSTRKYAYRNNYRSSDLCSDDDDEERTDSFTLCPLSALCQMLSPFIIVGGRMKASGISMHQH